MDCMSLTSSFQVSWKPCTSQIFLTVRLTDEQEYYSVTLQLSTHKDKRVCTVFSNQAAGVLLDPLWLQLVYMIIPLDHIICLPRKVQGWMFYFYKAGFPAPTIYFLLSVFVNCFLPRMWKISVRHEGLSLYSLYIRSCWNIADRQKVLDKVYQNG